MQRMMEQQAAQMAAQQQAAAQAAAQPKPAPQPQQQQRPQTQQFTYPQKKTTSDSKCFIEVPVDKSKPRATLTKAEEQATDITKWFNFSRK
jgi:hypothetical protein